MADPETLAKMPRAADVEPPGVLMTSAVPVLLRVLRPSASAAAVAEDWMMAPKAAPTPSA